jgi:hypothetical protein
LAVLVAELPQSVEALLRRALQLSRFGRRLARGDFLGAAKELGLAVIPKGVHPRKAFASNWLEYSFGWKPSLQDVYNALDILAGKPQFRVRFKARAYDLGRHFTSSGVPHTGFYTSAEWNYLLRCEMGCKVQVVNPTAFLLNQLGLDDPGSLVWERVPFSFLIDWLSTVGTVIASASDFRGLAIVEPYTSYSTGKPQFYHIREPNQFAPMSKTVATFVYMERVPELQGPTLSLRPYKVPGKARAANAFALLVQFLDRMR